MSCCPTLPCTLEPAFLMELRILASCMSIARTGSREICNPAPQDTDEDWIVLVSNMVRAVGLLEERGFVTSTDQSYQGMQSPFQSFRRGAANILITDDQTFYEGFVAATSVARRLNLLDKTDRIALFRAVLYRETCEMKVAA